MKFAAFNDGDATYKAVTLSETPIRVTPSAKHSRKFTKCALTIKRLKLLFNSRFSSGLVFLFGDAFKAPEIKKVPVLCSTKVSINFHKECPIHLLLSLLFRIIISFATRAADGKNMVETTR